MRMFFFGTLMDIDLLATVLGHDPAELAIRPGLLGGFDRRRAHGEAYPVLIGAPGSWVDGSLVDGLSPIAVERIQFFEGAEYTQQTVTVEVDGGPVEAVAFMATDQLPPSEDPWSLATWRRNCKAHAMIAAEIMMPQFGVITLTEMDARWEDVKAEADRRLAERTAAQ